MCWARHCGFNPPKRRIFPEEVIFPLRPGVNMGCDSILPKLSDESINRGLVCGHMHSKAQTQKNPDFHVLDGWMPATKTHPTCTIYEDGMWRGVMVGLKTNTKISPKGVNPRDIAVEHRRRRTQFRFLFTKPTTAKTNDNLFWDNLFWFLTLHLEFSINLLTVPSTVFNTHSQVATVKYVKHGWHSLIPPRWSSG